MAQIVDEVNASPDKKVSGYTMRCCLWGQGNKSPANTVFGM